MLLKRCVLSALALMALVLPSFAQESASPSVSTQVGTIRLDVPEAWIAVPGQGGAIIVSNYDLRLGEQAGGGYPAGTALMQISTGVLSQLPAEDFGELGADASALDYLTRIAELQEAGEVEVQEIVQDELSFAKLDTSTDENDNIIYFLRYAEDNFAFILTASFAKGDLEPITAEFERIIGTIERDVEAPIPDKNDYSALPQSFSEEGFPVLGDPSAPVQIRELSSFSCSHCRDFHDTALPELLPLIAEGKLAFTYVPLHSIGGIPGGDSPARAAYCAGQQGKFWEYHDALFGWQDFTAFAFAYDRLTEGALNLELDMSAFETCLNSDEALPTLEAALSFAQSVPGFSGTPTILLNGEVVNWSPIPALLEQINAIGQ